MKDILTQRFSRLFNLKGYFDAASANYFRHYVSEIRSECRKQSHCRWMSVSHWILNR